MAEHPWLAALQAALDAERRWARAEHERLRALPWDERVAAGLSWPPLRVEGVDEGRRRVVSLRAPRALHDGLGRGELALLAPLGDPDRGLRAVVADVDGAWAELRLEEGEDGRREALPGWLDGEVAVSRRFDDRTFERYAAALERADRLGPRARGATLRDALLGLRPPEPPPPQRPLPPALDALDDAQRRAAAAARAGAPIALVHGPPGTGKTWLLARLARAWVDEGQRVLALADSNAAVDHLAVSIAARGVRVLRLGTAERIGPAAWPLSMDARLAAGPYKAALDALDRDIDRRMAERGRGVGELLGERRRLRRQAWDQEVREAPVIAATFGTLGRLTERLPPADLGLVDEATQATEPAVWTAVPLCDRLVLVGDPEQLGPVVTQPGNPLQRSLLERLLAEQALPMPMLEVQHRMRADIQQGVASVYGPTYRPAPEVAAHALRDLPGVADEPLTLAGVLWIDTAGAGLDEARDPATLSLVNAGEVDLVAGVVERLRGLGVAAEHIGVIAPYSAQVRRLREALPGVEVASVNAFQGREREVIVCSFVRSNAEGELGFVADRRRLTVALTRARRLWVGVGDASTLASDRAFAALLEDLGDRGAWASVWEPPWSDMLP